MSGRIAGEHLEKLKKLDLYNQSQQERKKLFEEKMLPWYPETRISLPHPEVAIKDEFKKKKGSNNKRDGKYVNFSIFERTPMGDWDFPDDIHDSASVTIRHAGDAIDSIKRFTHDNKDSNFRVYLTPGGVRAFDMTRRLTPRQYQKIGEDLNIDPQYLELSRDMVAPYGMEGIHPEQGFSSRLSSKPGRSDDFVAYYLGSMGQGLPHPTNKKLVTQFHDIPIARNISQEGIDPIKLNDKSRNLLFQQIQTIEPIYRDRISERLKRLGVNV